MMASKKDKITGDALGTGRRKSSVARVRLRSGSGKILVNQSDFATFFCNEQDRKTAIAPLEAAGKKDEVDVVIRVHGGGTTGQSGACRMGIARALVSMDEEMFAIMRDGGYLTRDSRMKKRKKIRSPRRTARDSVFQALKSDGFGILDRMSQSTDPTPGPPASIPSTGSPTVIEKLLSPRKSRSRLAHQPAYHVVAASYPFSCS